MQQRWRLILGALVVLCGAAGPQVCWAAKLPAPIATAAPVFAPDLYAKWQGYEKAGAMDALLHSLRTPPSLEGLMITLDFLKQRIFEAGATHPVYFIVYAQLLWATGDVNVQETAAQAAGIAALLMETDQARCADQTAGEKLIPMVLHGLDEPLGFLKKAPPANQNKLFQTILDVEAKKAQRPVDRWVCASGRIATQQTRALMDAHNVKPLVMDDLTLGNGKVQVLPEWPEVQIQTIPDAAWQAKRETLRASFKDRLLTGLKAAQK